MKEPTVTDSYTSGRAAGWLLSGIGLSLQGATAAASLRFLGTLPGSTTLAIVVAAGEASKIAVPHLVHSFVRNRRLVMAGASIVIGALSYLISIYGVSLALEHFVATAAYHRDVDNAARKSAQEKMDQLTLELAAIPETRDAAVIQADIDKVVTDTRSNGCQTRDGTYSRIHCADVDRWRIEKSHTEHREKLNAEIDAARRVVTRPAQPAPRNVLVNLVSEAAGVSEEVASTTLKYLLAGLIEVFALYLVLAGQSLRSGPALRRVRVATQPPLSQAGGLSGQSGHLLGHHIQHIECAVLTDFAFANLHDLQRRVLFAVHSNGGTLFTSFRELSASLSVTRSEVNQVLRRLEANGWLRLHTSPRGTTLYLLRELPEEVVASQRKAFRVVK